MLTACERSKLPHLTCQTLFLPTGKLNPACRIALLGKNCTARSRSLSVLEAA